MNWKMILGMFAVAFAGFTLMGCEEKAQARWVTRCDSSGCSRVWVQGPVASAARPFRSYNSTMRTGRVYRWRQPVNVGYQSNGYGSAGGYATQSYGSAGGYSNGYGSAGGYSNGYGSAGGYGNGYGSHGGYSNPPVAQPPADVYEEEGTKAPAAPETTTARPTSHTKVKKTKCPWNSKCPCSPNCECGPGCKCHLERERNNRT